jgi:spore maturation protein CgeB
VIFGLSITSSWGNGHATTYRALVKALARRGHRILFVEHDSPWYAQHRDMPRPEGAHVVLYSDFDDLVHRCSDAIRKADIMIVGSYTRNGIAIGEWLNGSSAEGVTAFYDIDTPITLRGLEKGGVDYISSDLIREYDIYLSFTGGPTLRRLQSRHRARFAKEFYCSADPDTYYPEETPCSWDLGYMGTYSPDRAAGVRMLLIEPARSWPSGRIMVAGALYPEDTRWPPNITHIEHVTPDMHRQFYGSQRFTLSLTREPMVAAGFSPSVRLFEAASCATPIISDYWEGIDTFFEPGKEILIAKSTRDILEYIQQMPESKRAAIGRAARKRLLSQHTAAHRAVELERCIDEISG